MTDNKLFKPVDTLTDLKIKTSASLLERLKQTKSNLKHTLLIDLSGSMNEYTDSYKTKRQVVEEIVDKLPAGLKKFAFSGNCERIEGPWPIMGGGTNLGGAFREMHLQSINEIILLTDGQPDSERQALEQAKGLKLEIIYIGPEPRPKFLEDLAKACNGNFTTVDMLKANSSLELENKIKGLLGK